MWRSRRSGWLVSRVGGHPLSIGGTGMRGVLAMLLLEPNQVVPLDRIVDVRWAHEPPSSARTSSH